MSLSQSIGCFIIIAIAGCGEPVEEFLHEGPEGAMCDDFRVGDPCPHDFDMSTITTEDIEYFIVSRAQCDGTVISKSMGEYFGNSFDCEVCNDGECYTYWTGAPFIHTSFNEGEVDTVTVEGYIAQSVNGNLYQCEADRHGGDKITEISSLYDCTDSDLVSKDRQNRFFASPYNSDVRGCERLTLLCE